MSILSNESFTRLIMNGKVIFETKQTMVESITKLVAAIQDSNLTSSSFSSLTLEINRRPISDDSLANEFQKLLTDHRVEVVELKDTDSMEGFPDITWREYHDAMEEPIFVNRIRLARTKDRSAYTHDEIDSIKQTFLHDYANTKWEAFIGAIESPK